MHAKRRSHGADILRQSRPLSTIVVCVSATLAGAALASAYARVIEGNGLYGAVAGAVIVAPIAVFEALVMQGRIGEPLRRLPLWGSFVLSSAVWAVCIVAGLLVITPVVLGLEAFPAWYDRSSFLQDATFALIMALLVNFWIRIHALVGARVLLNFLLGRYHRPLGEQQVFMFVDFLDARGLSRRLGDVRAQSLIAAVFFDIDAAIDAFGGEIHRYIGDELVVTWPHRRATKDARCVGCAIRIGAVLRSNARRYEEIYGERPRLRIALHGGPVVVSEIGDDRREIVYFGDTINTTARLRGLAKKIERELVISAALAGQMQLPDAVHAEDMGAFALSGKSEQTRVIALHDRRVRNASRATL